MYIGKASAYFLHKVIHWENWENNCENSTFSMGSSLLNIHFYVFCYYGSQVHNGTIKNGIGLAKVDFLAFTCVTLAVTLHFWQTSVTHINSIKSIFINLMPTYNGYPANLRSIETKT